MDAQDDIGVPSRGLKWENKIYKLIKVCCRIYAQVGVANGKIRDSPRRRDPS